MTDDVTKIIPDQFVELVGRDVARVTPFLDLDAAVPVTDVVAAAISRCVRRDSQSTEPAADQGTQQILMAGDLAAHLLSKRG